MKLPLIFQRSHRAKSLKFIGIMVVLLVLFFVCDEEFISNSRKLGRLAEAIGVTPVMWGMRIFFMSLFLLLLLALPDGAKTDETIDRMARQKHQFDNSIRREK
ncbi:hypothetical protein [Asticcacaulis tiandongensis]|uniref:hypothetical protein n=1 Tax=Asticcacaulis tiandongensis TaxID=2565365 RepID=UPI00112A43BB|nr:hypothetical protein [Asticcacaulis tiandongensis]